MRHSSQRAQPPEPKLPEAETLPSVGSGAPSWQQRLSQADPSLRVHLLGIGGAGLGPIAWVLHELGVQVSGSDRQANEQTARLQKAGIPLFLEQRAENLTQMPPEQRPHLLLMSSAVGPDNPERQAAEDLGIPVVKRSQFLPALLAQRRLIAVAGSHGKSTTSAMIAQALQDAGVDAGYILGSSLEGYGNARAGSAPWFVLEADEYDHMFLGLRPTVAVITNVEWDHPDCYPTPASFRRAFAQFTDNVHREGVVISCGDDPGAEQLRLFGPSRRQWITYGLTEEVDIQAQEPVAGTNGGYRAQVCWWQAPIGELRLQVPGLHNLRNALAALAVARFCGVDAPQALASLGRFPGIARRFQLKGEAGGVTVIDDYAHHPTEIRATLAAARHRFPDRRIWAVFQPHTFSRTRQLLQEMAASLEEADQVIVTDIYPAREQDDGSVHAGQIVAASPHPAIRHIPSLEEAARHLARAVETGDVVITLGAGDGYRVGEWLLEALRDSQVAVGG